MVQCVRTRDRVSQDTTGIDCEGRREDSKGLAGSHDVGYSRSILSATDLLPYPAGVHTIHVFYSDDRVHWHIHQFMSMVFGLSTALLANCTTSLATGQGLYARFSNGIATLKGARPRQCLYEGA